MVVNQFKIWQISTVVACVAYAIGCVLSILNTFGIPDDIGFALDNGVAPSAVMCLIAILFAMGLRELHLRQRKDMERFVGFTLTGVVLAAAVSAVGILKLLAGLLSKYALDSEDFEDWNAVDEFTPAIWLVIFALIAFHPLRNRAKVEQALKYGEAEP